MNATKMLKAGVGIAVVLLCALPAAAQQEEKVVELEKVVVTATRAEAEVKDLPMSVSVISREEIEKSHAKTLHDVLNAVAGVKVKQNRGLVTSAGHDPVWLRGTGDGNRTLILKDGIPLNTLYLGNVDIWGYLSADDVERIEIIRGAASAVYGGNAMGGVINIITRTPKDKTKANLKIDKGDMDTTIASFNFSSRVSDRFAFRASAGGKKTGGYVYMEKKDWKDYYAKPTNETFNANLKSELMFDNDSILNIEFDYYQGKPTSRESYRYETKNDIYKPALTYRIPINGIDYKAMLYSTDNRYRCDARQYNSTTKQYDKFYYDSDLSKDEWGMSLQGSKRFEKNVLTCGTDLRGGEADCKYTYSTGDRIYGGKQFLYSLFGDYQMFLAEKVTLNLGARYDGWKHTDGSFYDENKGGTSTNISYTDRSDSAFSPKAGIAYQAIENLKIRASYGTAFKTPGLYYLYKSGPHGKNRFDLGNPELKPEKMTYSYDVGCDFEPMKNISLSLTYYQSSFEDFMYDKTLATNEIPDYFKPEPKQSVKQKVNIGQVDIDGFEAGLEVKFADCWSGFVNYTNNRSTIERHELVKELVGKDLAYVPRKMTNIGLTYNNPRLFTANLCLRKVGECFGDEQNTKEKLLKAYSVLDVKLSRKLSDAITLSVSVDNATDEEYKESTDAFAPPRSVMATLAVSF